MGLLARSQLYTYSELGCSGAEITRFTPSLGGEGTGQRRLGSSGWRFYPNFAPKCHLGAAHSAVVLLMEAFLQLLLRILSIV